MGVCIKLATRSLRKNKGRTLITLMGIVLSVLMVCTIFTLLNSMLDSAIDSIIEKDGYFEVQFKGGTDKAEVILQSWSGGADWARVSPTEVTEKDGIVYAKYSYDDVEAAFGTTDFSKVDRFHVGAANGDIEVLSVKYIVVKSTEPVDPVDPVDPDKPEQDPYVSIFWGAKSCGSWGQAVSVMTSKNYGSLDVSYLSANGYFYVEYSGAENELELILQSWSGGASWARVQPSETGRANDHYYAKFTYADCVKELGTGFDKLDQLHVAALISPLHDKDTNPSGEPKKPHYHVLLMFEGVKDYETQVKPIFAEIGGVGREMVNSARGYARYLCHLDNPEKAQYEP